MLVGTIYRSGSADIIAADGGTYGLLDTMLLSVLVAVPVYATVYVTGEIRWGITLC